jgi:hypothetical protein
MTSALLARECIIYSVNVWLAPKGLQRGGRAL